MAVSASTPAQTVAWTSARSCHAPSTFRSCRSSRLQRFPPQRPDPKIGPSTARGFVAPRSRSWSSPRFRPLGLSAVRDPKVAAKSSPVARTLRSFPLFGSRPVRHRFLPPHGGDPRSPPGRSLSPSSHRTAAVSPRLRAPDSTSGLSSAEESVAPARCCHPAELDAPMGFGSNTFRACRGSLLRAGGEPRFAVRCPGPRPASPARERGEGKDSRLCLAPKGPMLASDPKVGARRSSCWQPEDCYASGPPAASAPLAGGSDGIGRRRRPDPRTNPRRAATRRIVSRRNMSFKHRWAPMKNPRVRAASLRRGRRGFPPPVRFTRRCSVSGHRVTLRRAPHGPAHRPASKLADRHRWSEPPRPAEGTRRHHDQERETRHRLPARSLHRSGGFSTEMERGSSMRHPSAAPRRASRRTRSRSPRKGTVGRRSRTRRCGLVAPAHLQQAGECRPRARQTSSPSRSGQVSVRGPEPPGDPEAVGPTLARRERGGSAQRTRVSGWRSVAGHRSGPRRTEPKPDSAGLVLSKACLVPNRRSGRDPDRCCRSGDGVERVDVHVKEHFRRTILSVRTVSRT
jgi:hypothetical protein